jgi:alkylation response protein AidB-like acyl-CoA dehydrogenase
MMDANVAMTDLSPFTEEEEMFRNTVRNFLDRELEPNADKFLGDIDYDRQFWRKAGAAGLLGAVIPEARLAAISRHIFSSKAGRMRNCANGRLEFSRVR